MCDPPYGVRPAVFFAVTCPNLRLLPPATRLQAELPFAAAAATAVCALLPLLPCRCHIRCNVRNTSLEPAITRSRCPRISQVRAGGRKSVPKVREIRNKDDYIPSTDPYSAAGAWVGPHCVRRPACMPAFPLVRLACQHQLLALSLPAAASCGQKPVPAAARLLLVQDPNPAPHPASPLTCPPSPPAECMHDLLEAAARMLVVGGRLVYFLAAAPGFYSEEEVPRHPMLEVGREACWGCVSI